MCATPPRRRRPVPSKGQSLNGGPYGSSPRSCPAFGIAADFASDVHDGAIDDDHELTGTSQLDAAAGPGMASSSPVMKGTAHSPITEHYTLGLREQRVLTMDQQVLNQLNQE